ncbi:hypothetical protein FDI21_gp225 [Pseudomonas phage Noxifer]|uniref:Uncharacterized protein n=1 Tax=Pseudomonas phage Noxifer TaxID=2006684 RepID=A0A1Y0T0L6_9CAUD|nr:hypothetical protein FDI21_gp225 [Pseudomonas phage Noxifer]ARV77486.1 hypothetical protein NOXIFER_321 [Pseudomonas phage Noxifer]
MRARCTTMQEMKAYTCEESGCNFRPSYQVMDTDSGGCATTKYLCNDHYADFQHQQVQAHTKEYCELCGNPDTEFFDSPKFDDANPGKIYRVCSGCKAEQEELAREEFEEEETPAVPEPDPDGRDLDDSKYDEF